MKKYLLLALSLFVTGISFAQTTIETARELDVTGVENSYTDESITGNVTAWWKYTATDDVILTTTSTGSTRVYEIVDGQQCELKTLYRYDNSTQTSLYSAPVSAGNTVYIYTNNYSSNTVAITVKGVEPNKGVGKGMNEDAPLGIETGYEYFIGTYSGSSYSIDVYGTYKATEDGVLVFTSTSSFNLAVNGGASSYATTNYEPGSSTTTYKLNVSVKANEEYSLHFNIYNPIFITATMTHPEPGTLDNPFVLTEGENTVPAAFGDYYYTFTNTEAGYAEISSEGALPGGQVKVYNYLSSISSGYTYATSQTGSFNVRFETPQAGTTYYIVIEKTDATDADQTFTLTTEPYAAGDKEANPILIEDELPATLTCKNTNLTTYHAIEIPAGTQNKFLCVDGLNVTNSYTQVAVYPEGSSAYYGKSGYGSVKAEVSNTGEIPVKYIIRWEPYNETEAIRFTVSLEDIAQGDLITNPITAQKGANVLPGDGTKYYTYTATLTGKMVVTSPKPETTLTFPKGTDSWSGTYSPIVSGTQYTLDVTEGTVYLITVSNATKDETFTLEESEYEPGESRETAIEVENGEYAYMNNTSFNVWIKYTVKQDGILAINCNSPYNSNNSVTYGKATESSMSQMTMVGSDYTTVYSAVAPAKAGDVYIVNLSMKPETTTDGSPVTAEERKVTFTERAPEAGESAETAITILKGETVTIPKADRVMPIWGKIYLQPGEVKMILSQSMQAKLYSDLENANSDNGIEYYSRTDYAPDYSSSTTYIAATLGNEEPAGWHYIKFYGNYSACDLTLTGDGAVAQGDVIGWPLEAAIGDNVISSDGTKYYTYTTTTDGRLSVTVNNDANAVSFLNATGDESYEATVEDKTSTIEVTESTNVIIRIDETTEGNTFTLTETEYEQGEFRNNPIIVENGEYTVANTPSNTIWLQYTVAGDGYLTIAWPVPFNPDFSIAYGTADAEDLTPLTSNSDKTNYSAIVKVNAGDVYLVNIAASGDIDGTKVTFTETSGDPTAIKEAQTAGSRSSVSINGRTLNVSADGARVSIHRIDGSNVAESTVNGSRTFGLSAAGIYLVTIDGTTRKILVK